MDDNQLLEHFKQIQNILTNREEPVDMFMYAKKFNISTKQSKLLLNTFVSQTNALNEYNVIFTAEMLIENKIKSVLIPCFSKDLEVILASADNLFDFGVFGVFRKDKEFMLNDYSVFLHENECVSNIQITKSETEQKPFEIVESKPNNISTNKGNSISNSSSLTAKSGILLGVNNNKKTNTAASVNKVNVKKDEKLNDDFSSKVNISQTNQVNEIKADFVEMTDNKHKDIIKTDIYGEESYYGGPPQVKSEDLHEEIQTKRKRTDAIDPQISQATKKKKETIQTSNNSSTGIIKAKYEEDQNVQMNGHHSDGESNSVTSSVPKKVKKTRRVKKTNTYYDEEKGYMRTVDEWEEEEYWTDEKPKPQILHNPNPTGHNAKKPAKKVAAGQASLHSFFNK